MKQLHANSRYKEVNKEQNGKWIAISIFQVISFFAKIGKKLNMLTQYQSIAETKGRNAL